MLRAVALFSGGLDSMLAVRIMQRQGFEVEALNVRTLFECCQAPAAAAAERLGVRLTVAAVADDYLRLLRHPRFGFGKGLNPCVDCRIYMAHMAKRLLEQIGAQAVVTGEVLGQRPMSQKRRDLEVIARHGGLEGRLLRPLSAQLLPETDLEREGLVDRRQLYGFVGQGRGPLLALAAELGIADPPTPSGGCALAQPTFADLARRLLRATPDAARWDLELLSAGRQLWTPAGERVVLGRNARENGLIESFAARSDARDCALVWPANFQGPTALVVACSDAAVAWAAQEIVARSRNADPATAQVHVRSAAGESTISSGFQSRRDASQ